MKITKLNRSDFVAILSQSELSDYSLCFESLDAEMPDTQRLLLDLLRLAETKPDSSLSRMCVDAFRCDAQICVFVAFRPKKRFRVIKKQHTVLIKVFDCNSLLDLISLLRKQKSVALRIYKSNNAYYAEAAFCSIDNFYLSALLTEFGEAYNVTEVLRAAISEHAEALAEIKPKP